MDLVIRWAILLGSGIVSGVAGVRATKRPGKTNKLALGALSIYSFSTMLSQFTLLGTPPTIRTFFTGLAVLCGLVYAGAVVRKPPTS